MTTPMRKHPLIPVIPAIESFGLASCVVGPDGIVRSLSPTLAELLAPESGAIGRSLTDLLAAWQPVDGDTAVLRRGTGDDQIIVEVRTSFLSDSTDVVVAFFDVTEHHALERELAELAQFPEKNPGPVLWLDREGTILRGNAAAKRAFGEDIVGDCWLDRCPDMTEELWARARAAAEPFVADVDLDDACYAMSYLAADGGDFVFTFGADITDRRRAEKKIAEVARFPDMNPGPVLRLDASGAVLLANRAARDVFGGDLLGASWETVLPASAGRWDELRVATQPVPIETRLGDRDYQFTHVSDPESRLVFVYGADVTEQKRAERGILQSERMATLGTLAAGIAHELNNPAAAARRAADQLRDAFARQQQTQFALDAVVLEGPARAHLRALEAQARTRAAEPNVLDTMRRSDLEGAIEDWLDDRGIDNDWDIAPMLVEQGLDPEALDALAADLTDSTLNLVLAWAAATFPVYRLAHEIGQATGRISEIVGAMKSYSYLGQAPRQEVDLHEGLDNTLIILRSKLKTGVEVTRNYAVDLPPVPAFGSELNQVWTNLIDNAVGAMHGRGAIWITTSLESGAVVVEIRDDGPGIPADIIGRVFDPFFTTKEPGQGTGLGLATTYAIVTEKHGGEISVTSRPGETCFTVRLPLGTKES